MEQKRKNALGVTLLGIDERSCKLLALFFKGPCEGFAEIIEDTDASVDIIDTHFADSEHWVENSLARTPQRAIIVLTSNKTDRLEKNNLLYLDKPINANQMLSALDWASDIIRGKHRQKPFFAQPMAAPLSAPVTVPDKPVFQGANIAFADRYIPTAAPTPHEAVVVHEVIQKKLIDLNEQRKKTKYRTATIVTEDTFNDFIGVSPEDDFNDISQRYHATYNIKNHYQGYVQYAYQSSTAKMHTLQLNSSIWKPLIVLPHSREIWIDADDTLLKQIAGTWLDIDSMNISSVDQGSDFKSVDLEKIQDINTFLWKLALWTSRGRYPKSIDIDRPVYLKQWPDFTRLVVTPHALRITGLLVSRGTETMLNIATLLNIELRYVYIFISASHAIGLAAQAKRQVDNLIQITLPEIPPDKKELYGKIVNTLQK